MRKFSIELPKYRLQVKLNFIKRRKPLISEPILPTRAHLNKYRSGNFVSKFFRYVFEHKNVKRMLGANIALLMVGANVVSGKTLTTANIALAQNNLSEDVVQLKTEKSVQYPVKIISITQKFSIFHTGIDLDGNTGDPIWPIKNGRVAAIDHSNVGYGNAILVDHGNQITSLYAHLSKIEVKPGDEVTTDTEIGKMGATGHATGSHLHLEVRDNGLPINPLIVLPQ